MAQVGEATIRLKFDGSSINSELKSVEATVKTSGAKLSKRWAFDVGAISGITSKVFSKVSSIISSNLDSAISRTDILNNYSNVMSNLGVSTDEANNSIQTLSDGLDGLPTTLNDAALSVERFTSKNNDVQKSTDMFLALNNALLAGGASADLQSTAMEQISQAYAKGKPDMMEWRSLMTAMPAQLNQVAQSMGTTADALGEGLRSGEISMDDFMGAIMRLNEEGVEGFENFQKQAENATGGIATNLKNLQTQVSKVIAAALNGDDMTKPLETLVKRFNKVVPNIIKAIIQAGTGIASALPEILPPILQAIVDSLPTIMQAITSLITSLAQQLPVLIPILLQGAIQLFMALVKAIPQIITSLVDALPQIIDSIVTFLTDPANIAMIIAASVELFFGLVKAVPQILGALLGAFANLVGKLWDGLKRMFGEFAGNFGEFITGIFKGAINGVLAFIEGFINAPVDILNGFIDIINATFGIVGVNLGKIGRIGLPRLASGGIVEASGGGSVILAGEAGDDEWVVPTAKMASLIDQVNAGTNGKSGGITVNMNNYINNEMDADEIGRRMMDSIRRATA